MKFTTRFFAILLCLTLCIVPLPFSVNAVDISEENLILAIAESGLLYVTEETVNCPNITTLESAAFIGCSKLVVANFPNIQRLESSTFQRCSNLQSINAPNITFIGQNAIRECKAITSINFPYVTKMDQYGLSYNSALERVELPMLTTLETGSFSNCSKLRYVDLSSVTSMKGSGTFYGAILETLIIRSETVCTLSSTAVFNGTGIANGTGYVYVPDDLVESYKTAANWSTYADQIKPLSELQ